MKDIYAAPFIKEMTLLTANMYHLGYNERNGGNISYMLNEAEVKEYIDIDNVLREIPTGFDATKLIGKYFLVTGTGKYFKNIETDPENNLGIVKIAEDGTTAQLLWGFKDGSVFTSEFPSHLMSHIARIEKDPENRVIMHAHPTYTLAMNHIHPLTEKDFTRTIWGMCTECVVVFPDGIGVLPWMLCGNNEIGIATAEKMKSYRIVVWGLHGVFCAGKSLDEAFGLMETVEKAAQLYMLATASGNFVNAITDENLLEVVKGFGLEDSFRRDFLDM